MGASVILPVAGARTIIVNNTSFSATPLVGPLVYLSGSRRRLPDSACNTQTSLYWQIRLLRDKWRVCVGCITAINCTAISLSSLEWSRIDLNVE